MPGLVVYDTLLAALKDGFAVYDRTAGGYLVRQRIGDRWQMAIVRLAA